MRDAWLPCQPAASCLAGRPDCPTDGLCMQFSCLPAGLCALSSPDSDSWAKNSHPAPCTQNTVIPCCFIRTKNTGRILRARTSTSSRHRLTTNEPRPPLLRCPNRRLQRPKATPPLPLARVYRRTSQGPHTVRGRVGPVSTDNVRGTSKPR
jgi:hypothetical protein